MKYEEIIKLLDAGYSRDEILAMKEAPADPAPAEPAPAEPAPAEPNMTDVMNEIKKMFNDMRKEFTAFNIMNSNMPGDPERTSEDIIANIINPDQKKK